MTDRQVKYKRNRLLGMNPLNAARAAGYSEKTALGKSYRMERSERVGMADLMDRMGLTDNAILAELKRIAGGSIKLHACDIYVKQENGKIVLNQNSNDFIEIPDDATRVKAIELLAKLKGRLVNKTELSGELKGPQPLIIAIPVERQKEYNDRLAGIPRG